VDNLKEKYNSTQSWSEKVRIMGLYHLCQLEINNKWTIQNTANYFKVSMGLASENLRLAELFTDFPDLANQETRKDALALIEKRRFPRLQIKKEGTFMAEVWKPQSIEIYVSWVEAIESEASDKLNDWEQMFIGSIQTRLLNGVNLSQPQAEKLEQIYTKHTK
jgi:hypothetical protein